MTRLFHTRRPELTELMDDPNCDLEALERTYAAFRTLNRFIAGWGRIYTRWIRPHLQEGPATLVDIGCGGADVPVFLTRLAKRDGLELRTTAADPDPRATRFARRQTDIEVLECHSRDLVALGRRFDFVISNHLLHHLDDEAFDGLMEDSAHLATCAVIHNDIRRDDLGYLGFSALGLAFPRTFIRADGLRSIKRSYTASELQMRLPVSWRVETLAPYRLLAVFEP